MLILVWEKSLKLFHGLKTRNAALILMLAIIIPISILFSILNYRVRHSREVEMIDEKLKMAAGFMQTVLPDNFHDRIVDENSISATEYTDIVSLNNQLCTDQGLEYLWSLILADGIPRFTSATSPDKQVGNSKHAAFFEAHSNPEFYEEAFQTGQPVTRSIHDKWGNLYVYLLPCKDSKDRTYIIGSAIKLEAIESVARIVIRDTIKVTLFLLIPGSIICLLISRRITKPISELSKVAEAIGEKNYNIDIDIKGTQELAMVSKQFRAMCSNLNRHIKDLRKAINETTALKEGVNAGPIVLFTLDLKNNLQADFISENITIAGYTADMFLSGKKNFADIVPDHSLKKLRDRLGQAIADDEDTYVIECDILWGDGTIQPHLNWYRIMKDEQGVPAYLQGMSLHIKDLKEAQHKAELYSDELQELHRIVSASPIMLYRVKANEEMTTEFISDNYAQLGYDPESLRKGEIKWTDLMLEEDLKEVDKIVQESIAAGLDTHTTEVRLKWANGEYHWYRCWNQFIRNAEGHPVSIQGIMSEISDLKVAHERDILYQDRLRALTEDLMQAEDKERRLLAIALHDDIGQMLAALNMKIAALNEAPTSELADTLRSQIDELLSRIMSTTKSLTWEISPTSLYETDIAAGLERMAGEIKDLFGMETTIQSAGQRIVLDRNTSAIIFRCAKELLVNIAKHAGVTQADIGISHYGNKAHLVVSDEGCGFDQLNTESGNRTGYGLFSIRERIEHLGGNIRIETAPGQGTKVMLIIPLDVRETLGE